MKKFVVSAVSIVSAVAGSSQAASISVSPDQPLVNGSDIANFSGAFDDAANVGGGDDPLTYVAANRPAQGQTFTTGSNVGGYSLDAITYQTRPYALGYTDNYNNGLTTIRLGQISMAGFTPTTTETVGINGTNGFASDGEGLFVTYLLDTPVVLLPSTEYAFDVGSDGGFYETNGTNDAGIYADGFAFSSGSGGAGDLTATQRDGDRVFHVNLAAIPEPSIAILGSLGLIGLVLRRRL